MDGILEMKERFLVVENDVERIYNEFSRRGLTIGSVEDLQDEFIENIRLYDFMNEDSALYRYVLYVGENKYYMMYSDLNQKDFEEWIFDQKFVDALDVRDIVAIHARAYKGNYDEYDGSLEERYDIVAKTLIDQRSVRLNVRSVIRIVDARSDYRFLFSDFIALKLRNEFYKNFKLSRVNSIRNFFISFKYRVFDYNQAIETFVNPRKELNYFIYGNHYFPMMYLQLIVMLETKLIKDDLSVVK